MYKAVLVDDENFDLLGLQRLIPWDDLGIEVVCGTNKPLAALDYVQAHDIDILITDIKMPVMSGLELARLSRERHPEMKTVFISGYQDFEYAKTALKLRADGYILKPVDDDEIVTALRGVVDGLDARRRALPDGPLEAFEFMRGDLVLHLLDGSIDAATLDALRRTYPIELPDGPLRALVVEIDDAARLRAAEGEAAGPFDAVFAVVRDSTAGGEGLLCRIADNRIGLISAMDAAALNAALESLLADIRRLTPYTATIAVGQMAGSLSELPLSYREACQLIGGKMFLGKDRIILPGISQHRAALDVKDVDDSLDRLYAAISDYRLVDICDLIEDLFDHVRAFAEPVKVYHFSTHIVSRLESYLSAEGAAAAHPGSWRESGYVAVERFETVEDIKSWLRRTAFELSEGLLLHRQSRKPAWKLLPEIQYYVRTRLSGDITLKEAAAQFAYSPNHFGVLFKEQVGISFGDFVVRERMERARQLLRSPKLKVYEIAEEVGYNSLAYFSKTFREMFGMTPGDFRKQG
ncbi:helix-turn-helix domain-containing protein [Cohnella sp. 56]|uniref:helix-turn-helix domain-containing protein n=1 Tax=Cohnella sp. 56 TaxID=3113722 RepID=UPI0030EA48EA